MWVLLTLDDLVPPDVDVVIPVGARLLVVEAESVQKLVLHDGPAVTALADGHVLPSLQVPHEGPAPGGRIRHYHQTGTTVIRS